MRQAYRILESGEMVNGKRLAVVPCPRTTQRKPWRKPFRSFLPLWTSRFLVDDHSSDETVRIARELGLQIYVHEKNYGYGRNQQTCYREALLAGADIVVMVHPDYQYTPLLVTAMASMIAYDVYDVVLGSRIIGGGALKGGMPLYKYVSNRLLTAFQNAFTGAKLSEYHTGFRAFGRDVLHESSVAGEFRRFRLRQRDAGPGHLLRLPHRRGFLPDEILPGSILHQFPAQREVRLRGPRYHAKVQTPEVGNRSIPSI